jgi:hypothetical protein
MKQAYATKAMIKRAVDGARQAGLEFAGIELSPDGTIKLLPVGKTQPTNAYDRWQETRADAMVK